MKLCVFLLLTLSAVRGVAEEFPVIHGDAEKGDAVIGYGSSPENLDEAWEIKIIQPGMAYLNYKRAAWGERQVLGRPIHVCYARSKAHAVVGISENADRLKPVLITVLEALDSAPRIIAYCSRYSTLLARSAKYSSLTAYLKYLRSKEL